MGSQNENQNVCQENQSEEQMKENDSSLVMEGVEECGTLTTVTDLPTEMIEKIFSYLPAKEIYCNVRPVCHRLHDIADGYIPIGKQAAWNILIISPS